MQQTIFDLPEFNAYTDILAKLPHAEVYIVGGAVRDHLMSTPDAPITPKDVDFVIVGVDASEMDNAFPEWDVHGAFKVYIHPIYKCEFALARTERKVGTSYTGFEVTASPLISIKDDLLRRDLTINSIAINCVTRETVDPYGGIVHIRQKKLVPTSPAFMEDPLRILRVARFKARLGPGWIIDESVATYADIMRSNGEFDTIHVSRIVMELEKAVKTQYPHLFFEACEMIGVSDLYHDFTSSMRVKDTIHHSIGDMELLPFMVATAFKVSTCIVFGIEPQPLKNLSDIRQIRDVQDIVRAMSRMKTIKHPRTNEVLFTAASYILGNGCMRHLSYLNELITETTFASLVVDGVVSKDCVPEDRSKIVRETIFRKFMSYMWELK